jgi:hypothetical protein
VGTPDDSAILRRAWRLSAQRPWLRPAAIAGTLAAVAAVGASIALSDAPEMPSAAIASPADTLAIAPGSTTTGAVAREIEPHAAEPAPGGEQTLTMREAPRARRPSPARTGGSAARRNRAERPQLAQTTASLKAAQGEPRPAPRPASEVAVADLELEGLFNEPREAERAPVEELDPELEGLFANGRSATRGANGAPFPE